MTAGLGTVTEADVRAAHALLDALAEAGVMRDDGYRDGQSAFMAARGVAASWSADVRTAGYLEGLQEGRQQVARWVKDALEGEGL